MSADADTPLPREPLCDARALEERGRAYGWDVMEHGRPQRAFVLRIDGQPRAYLNRCLHVPVEMDWSPGEFLDSERCSIHGAAYDPTHGQCVGGPCGRGRLTALDVREEAGQVYWYPSRDIRPVVFDEAPPATPAAPPPAP
mgnify:CR=1 FL=1